MAEYVGFIMNMRPEWMDQGFRCRINGLPKEEAKIIFEETASKNHSDPTNIHKIRRTLEILFYENESWILQDSLNNYVNLTIEQRIPLYWALLICSFPIFYDVCKSIGNLTAYRDTITLSQARQPIYDKWGARNIIHQSVKKVFQTLKDFDMLLPCGAPGVFNIHRKNIIDTKLALYIVVAILSASEKDYMSLESIVSHRVLFPYEIAQVSQADIAACEVLRIDRMGDDVVIVGK